MTESDAPARLRLPDRTLSDGAGGTPVPLRQARHGTVLVLLGAALTTGDAGFVRALAAHRAALAAWDGRVLLIVADASAPATAAYPAGDGLEARAPCARALSTLSPTRPRTWPAGP